MSTKKKLDPEIIRVGDTIKVVNPQMFIRCGYNMELETETINIIERFKPEIEHLMTKVKASGDDCIDKVAKALAYFRIRQAQFGGKERQIFTEPHEELQDKKFKVQNINFVKTGKYFPPEGWDEGFSSGGLENEKTHKILTIYTLNEALKIEACNVEKVP